MPGWRFSDRDRVASPINQATDYRGRSSPGPRRPRNTTRTREWTRLATSHLESNSPPRRSRRSRSPLGTLARDLSEAQASQLLASRVAPDPYQATYPPDAPRTLCQLFETGHTSDQRSTPKRASPVHAGRSPASSAAPTSPSCDTLVTKLMCRSHSEPSYRHCVATRLGPRQTALSTVYSRRPTPETSSHHPQLRSICSHHQV